MRWIYPSTIFWEKDAVFQRPQQICKAIANLGEEVFFVECDRPDDVLYIKDGVKVVGKKYSIDKGQDTIFWMTHPDYIHLKDFYNANFFIFDYIDEMVEEFSVRSYNTFYDCLDNADLITVVSGRLHRIISDIKPNKPLLQLPNAADIEHFINAKSLDISYELQQFKKPIIGFMGSISSWIDIKLLYLVMKATPDMQWVFVGPDYLHFNYLSNYLDNIYFTGLKSYNDLPSYLGAFDVGIIPFEVRDMTNSSSPIKLYEYLAAGLPVLSTPIAEAVACPYAYIAETVEDWVASLKNILKGNLKESVEDRQLYAKQESWDARVKKLLKFIN